MKDYMVTFTDNKIGRNRAVGDQTFERVEDLDQLTARIGKFARNHLMSRDVDVRIDNKVLRLGVVAVGVSRGVLAATFTYTAFKTHPTREQEPF